MISRLLAALHQSPALDRSKNFTLFRQGEKPLGLWMVESGRLVLPRHSKQGRIFVVDVLEAGELAGLASSVTGEAHETGAETDERSRLRFLSRSDFLRIVENDLESSLAVGRLLAAQVAGVHQRIGETMFGSNSVKVANVLLEASHAEIAGLTHESLAMRVGTTRESVTRIVQEFKSRGALAATARIAVQSRSVLRSLAA